MNIEMANLMMQDEQIVQSMQPVIAGGHNLIRNTSIKVVPDNEIFHPIWEKSLRGLPKYPRRILRLRNLAIVAMIIQICAAILGMALYSLRRNTFFLFLNPFCILIAIVGLHGANKVNKCFIATHAVTTCAIFGSFMFFQVLEGIFQKKREAGSNVDETYLLLLFSLPYLIDFICGVVMFYFIANILDYEESQKSNKEFKTEEKYFLQLPDNFDHQKDNFCIICMDRPRSAVFYDCGHKVACLICASELRKTYLNSCPVCRRYIKDVIEQFNV